MCSIGGLTNHMEDNGSYHFQFPKAFCVAGLSPNTWTLENDIHEHPISQTVMKLDRFLKDPGFASMKACQKPRSLHEMFHFWGTRISLQNHYVRNFPAGSLLIRDPFAFQQLARYEFGHKDSNKLLLLIFLWYLYFQWLDKWAYLSALCWNSFK